MPEQRHVFRLHRSLVVALPQVVHEHLGVTRGEPVYWFLARRHEAVLTKDPTRKGGHPEGAALRRELTAARAEIALLKQRNEARDRTMYAEGYNVGYLRAQEALTRPHGASAERARRRQLYAYTFPDAAREQGKTRKRRSRAVTTLPGPDQLPAPDPSASPNSVEGDAVARGRSPEATPTS